MVSVVANIVRKEDGVGRVIVEGILEPVKSFPYLCLQHSRRVRREGIGKRGFAAAADVFQREVTSAEMHSAREGVAPARESVAGDITCLLEIAPDR